MSTAVNLLTDSIQILSDLPILGNREQPSLNATQGRLLTGTRPLPAHKPDRPFHRRRPGPKAQWVGSSTATQRASRKG